MSYKNSNRRDAAEHDIVQLWKRLGCLWIPLPPGIGFDGLLISDGEIYIVEIKTLGKWKLTAGEQACRNRLEQMGVTYHIIDSAAKALALIGRDFE